MLNQPFCHSRALSPLRALYIEDRMAVALSAVSRRICRGVGIAVRLVVLRILNMGKHMRLRGVHGASIIQLLKQPM